ncbi:hypothetical protein D3C80_1621210 [compost metagenome]
MFGGEGTIKSDFKDAHFFTARQQVVDRFFTGADSGPHQDHHAFGLRVAVILKWLIAAAGDGSKLVHRLLHMLVSIVVPRIGRFPRLEVGIRVG